MRSKRSVNAILPKDIPSLSPKTFFDGWSAREKIQSSRGACAEFSATSTSMSSRMRMNSPSLRDSTFATDTLFLMSLTHEYAPASRIPRSALLMYEAHRVRGRGGVLGSLCPTPPFGISLSKAVSPLAFATSWRLRFMSSAFGMCSRFPVSRFVLFTTMWACGILCLLSSW